MDKFCHCCGTALVHCTGDPSYNIDATATTDALIERISDGRMSVIKGDCPLEKMMKLFWADMKYTIVQFLRCHECGNVLFWGLCVRGAPIYKAASDHEARRWPWTNESHIG